MIKKAANLFWRPFSYINCDFPCQNKGFPLAPTVLAWKNHTYGRLIRCMSKNGELQ